MVVGSVCDYVGREVGYCVRVLGLGESTVLWHEGFVHKVRCMHCEREEVFETQR